MNKKEFIKRAKLNVNMLVIVNINVNVWMLFIVMTVTNCDKNSVILATR